MCLTDNLLARRVNEACLNGWPSLQNVALDGWQLRFSRGYTKRANSVSLLAPSRRAIEEKIDLSEQLYRLHRQPTIFQLSNLDDENVDPALDEAGFGPRFGESRVLYRDLTRTTTDKDIDGARVETNPSNAWLDAYAHIQGLNADAEATSRALFAASALPAAFSASLTRDGRIAAIAFVAVHDRIACLNAIATEPAFQRQGHARRAIGAALTWARYQGAEGACLPVLAENEAALALYAHLGFSTETSRYSYRIKPMATGDLP